MGYGRQFDFAIRRLLDNHQTMTRAGHEVWLRLRNFADVQNSRFAQLGFSIAPTGSLESGTEDVLVTPPPAVSDVSIHNIGQSAGKLRFGAKTFLISQTFVERFMQERGITDESLVWRGPATVGLVTDGVLFSIEDIKHDHISGRAVMWILTGNMLETK